MLNSKAFANAATIVAAVFYIICLVISVIAPDLLFSVANSWMHSINLEPIKALSAPSAGSQVWGFITISGLTWITTYITIELYNRFAKK